ncbi:SMI1/KNR4 family protein [Shewanella sp. 10N.286.54.B9]|uniref:SMI1/KNR4 family protein n=1 Tax=Shewanella sp. 10N.286.54.B9 TaxID=3229719 RepID=UPI0035503567
MNRTQVLNSTISKYGLELPKPYLDFLLKDEPELEIEIQDCYWFMATVLPSDWEGQEPLTLESDFSLDRLEPVPFIHALKMFLLTAQEFLHGNVIQNESGSNFTIERLSRGIAIGEENGDLLFIDANSFGVYAFYHDGYYVSEIAGSFDKLLQMVEYS